MNRIFDDGHITEESLGAFRNGKLEKSEKLQVLEHISVCDECADRLAEGFENAKTVSCPPDFTECLMKKVNQKKSGDNPEKEFRMYVFRVGLAVAATLVFIFSGVLNFDKYLSHADLPVPDLTFADKAAQQLSDFSDRLIHMEVFEHDKKEK